MSEEGARKMFSGERVDYDALLAKEAKGEGAPAGSALEKKAAISGRSILSDTTSANVIGVIRGSDRRLSREVVIMTAHLDHIGVTARAKPGEDAINNGAIDNASGVAVMLEAARMMTESGVRPKRTVAFVALTAEEKGLLGSQYMTINTPFPQRRAVANINIDMPVALYPFTDVIAFGAERSSIGATVEKAASAMGIALAPDPMPDENFSSGPITTASSRRACPPYSCVWDSQTAVKKRSGASCAIIIIGRRTIFLCRSITRRSRVSPS